jgi:hypothetical protein
VSFLICPDTGDNEAGFGRCGGKNPAPFPQARVTALVECGTHAVVAAEIDPWKKQERAQVARLLPVLQPDMLVLADSGVYSYELWKAACETGAALLWRVRVDLDLPVLSILPDGSCRSEVGDPQQKRHNREHERKRRASAATVDYIQLRVIE